MPRDPKLDCRYFMKNRARLVKLIKYLTENTEVTDDDISKRLYQERITREALGLRYTYSLSAMAHLSSFIESFGGVQYFRSAPLEMIAGHRAVAVYVIHYLQDDQANEYGKCPYYKCSKASAKSLCKKIFDIKENEDVSQARILAMQRILQSKNYFDDYFDLCRHAADPDWTRENFLNRVKEFVEQQMSFDKIKDDQRREATELSGGEENEDDALPVHPEMEQSANARDSSPIACADNHVIPEQAADDVLHQVLAIDDTTAVHQLPLNEEKRGGDKQVRVPLEEMPKIAAENQVEKALSGKNDRIVNQTAREVNQARQSEFEDSAAEVDTRGPRHLITAPKVVTPKISLLPDHREEEVASLSCRTRKQKKEAKETTKAGIVDGMSEEILAEIPNANQVEQAGGENQTKAKKKVGHQCWRLDFKKGSYVLASDGVNAHWPAVVVQSNKKVLRLKYFPLTSNSPTVKISSSKNVLSLNNTNIDISRKSLIRKEQLIFDSAIDELKNHQSNISC